VPRPSEGAAAAVRVRAPQILQTKLTLLTDELAHAPRPAEVPPGAAEAWEAERRVLQEETAAVRAAPLHSAV
jgi:hypothetical protein